MNIFVVDNYAKVKPSLLYLPSLILVAVALFLYMNDSLNDNGYAEIQKGVFFWLNSHLSQLPMLQHNLTQLGNSMIFMSFLAIFFVAAPKMWESPPARRTNRQYYRLYIGSHRYFGQSTIPHHLEMDRQQKVLPRFRTFVCGIRRGYCIENNKREPNRIRPCSSEFGCINIFYYQSVC